ncbi:MAG: aconitase/3-isopropylmalate dehydratase large subunit family protein [Acidimicrobiia bacterium]
MDASAPPPDPPEPASGMTMAEQVLARTAGLSRVSAGQYVTAAPDVLMCHEALTMCASQLRRVGVERLAHPERVHVVLDHFFPAPSAAAAKDHVRARRLVEQYGITNFHGHAGICHQVLVERACVRPGQLVLGTDSHSTTYGAVGAMGAGIGVTEMTYALATGELWFQVPPTVRVVLTGAGGPGLMAKDLVLALAGAHGTDVAQYAAIEFAGPLAERLSIAGRMTMANMGAELGAKFAAFPADDHTVQYLADAGADPAAVERFGPQPGAAYARTVTVDSTGLAPQVARPHNPGNVSAVGEVAGTAVHQAFLGSCTNARLEDLAVAAEVLAGRRVHPRVRLLVTPASQQVFLDAVRAGHIATLVEAGAHVTASGCGACPGGHQGLLGPGEVCVSSTNRNFVGRMGSAEAQVYLGSPATVAAAAVAGELIDPRELWTGSTL